MPLVVTAILLAFAITVVAAPRPKMYFTGNSSSRWSNTANWTLNNGTSGGAGRVPQDGDSIVITSQNNASAYVGNSQNNNGPTSTFTVTLNNVIIIVQKGATLQLGNGSNTHAGNTYYYYGVLALDNASAVSIEKGDSHTAAGVITADPVSNTTAGATSANNQVTIGGNVKFGGDFSYASVNSGGTGLVNGPARATSSTGVNAQGFSTGALPVVLVGFNANLTAGNKVNIEWVTQQEISTDHFNIERSNDGSGWQTLATVKGSGFSSMPRTYTCSDAAPQNGINLYRLRMVDFDGNFGFSDIVNVRLNSMGKISLYPNPSVNVVTVSLGQAPAADWTVSIVSTSGQVMLQKKFSKDLTSVNLPVNMYPTGNYMVEITDGVSSQNSKLLIAH